MRKLLFILLLVSGVASAQFTPTGSKTRFVNGIGLSASRAGSSFNTADSLVLFSSLDSALYFKYKGTARALAFANAYVPYTGATNNLNLGSYNLLANIIQASGLIYSQGTSNGKNVGIRFNSYQNKGIISSRDNTTGLPILLGDTTDNSVIEIPATTDATSTTAASVMMAGGLAVAKKLYAAHFYGYRGASGASAPPSNVSGLILENSAATGISILTPDANAARIQFGTASNNSNGLIYCDYNSGNQTMFLQVGSGSAGATTKLTLKGNGDVLVNSLGTGTVYSNSGVLTNTNPSDSTLKDSIMPIRYGLAEVLKLKPKTFYYKSDSAHTVKYGFIAQEVKPIMPDVVRKISKDSDKLGLETDGIYVTLVKAIQEQQAIIDDLKKRIAALENK